MMTSAAAKQQFVYLFLIIIMTVSAFDFEASQKTGNQLNAKSAAAQPLIYINQSDSIFILAKYGQTVSLPCIIYRQKNPELENIHAIWSKLNEKHRPRVLSIGAKQIHKNMRHRVKVFDINERSGSRRGHRQEHRARKLEMANQEEALIYDYSDMLVSPDEKKIGERDATKDAEKIVQNWQFEIRKLTYEDAGTYQCSLPLVVPINKNVTLRVIPDLVIEPQRKEFHVDEEMIIECKATLKATDRHRMRHRKKLIRENKESNTKNSAYHVHNRMKRPIIHWYKENEMLVPKTDKIEILTKHDQSDHNLHSTLTIHNPKVVDGGKYRCVYDDIQEQVEVKVNIKKVNYGFNNFLSSSSSMTTATQSKVLITNMCLIVVSSIFYYAILL